MRILHDPSCHKKKEVRPITVESFEDAEYDLSSVDILKVIETGDEYRIHAMMLDGRNRKRMYDLESGRFLRITPVEGSSWPDYSITEAGKRYIKAAEGI